MSNKQQVNERRRAPRFTTRLAATSDGVTLYTTNLSCTGTQLVCPALSRRLLRRQLDQSALQISLHFPNHGNAQVHCKVVYESDTGEESLLGIHFLEFETDSQQRLFTYIEQQAGPEFLV